MAPTQENKKTTSGSAKPAQVAHSAAMNGLFNDMTELMGTQYRTFAHSAERAAQELFGFWGRRMNAYAEHMKNLQKCQNSSDMLDAGNKFISRTVEDYSEETGELMKLGQDVLASTQATARNAVQNAGKGAAQQS